MNSADAVFGIVAKMLGMEGQAVELRALMDLYVEAVAQDERGRYEGEPMAERSGEEPRKDPEEEAGEKPRIAPAKDSKEKTVELPQKTPEAPPALPARGPMQRAGAPVEGYTGFLHIKCPHCGAVKTFCTKQPLRRARCTACGQSVPLEALTEARTECECGNHSKYLTNREEWGFDIPCVACGAPVPMEYRAGINKYTTIGKYAAKKRKGRKT